MPFFKKWHGGLFRIAFMNLKDSKQYILFNILLETAGLSILNFTSVITAAYRQSAVLPPMDGLFGSMQAGFFLAGILMGSILCGLGLFFFGYGLKKSAAGNRREYNVLLSIGMTNRQLAGLFLRQSVFSFIISFPLITVLTGTISKTVILKIINPLYQITVPAIPFIIICGLHILLLFLYPILSIRKRW